MASCGAAWQLSAPVAPSDPEALAPGNQSESAWTGRAAAVTHSRWLPGTIHIYTEGGKKGQKGGKALVERRGGGE